MKSFFVDEVEAYVSKGEFVVDLLLLTGLFPSFFFKWTLFQNLFYYKRRWWSRRWWWSTKKISGVTCKRFVMSNKLFCRCLRAIVSLIQLSCWWWWCFFRRKLDVENEEKGRSLRDFYIFLSCFFSFPQSALNLSWWRSCFSDSDFWSDEKTSLASRVIFCCQYFSLCKNAYAKTCCEVRKEKKVVPPEVEEEVEVEEAGGTHSFILFLQKWLKPWVSL